MGITEIIFVVFLGWSGWFTIASSSANYGLCQKGDITASNGKISFNSSFIGPEEKSVICERIIYAAEGRLMLSLSKINLIEGNNFDVYDGAYGSKKIYSSSSKGGKIYESTGNTMRVVLRMEKSPEKNGFSSLEGTFSSLPFASTCKCTTGIPNSFLKCRDNNSERKCTVYCNAGFIDVFNVTGAYACDLLNGKLNNKYKDSLGCVPLPLVPELIGQVNLTISIARPVCNKIKNNLSKALYKYLATKDAITRNSLCFTANNSQCFNYTCGHKGDKSFVSINIQDKATGLWNESGIEALSKAYNSSLKNFEKIANETIQNINVSEISVIKGSMSYQINTKCPSGTFLIGSKQACSKCPQGAFHQPATRSCEKCANGTFSTEGSSKCSSEKPNNVSRPGKCEIQCMQGKELNTKTGFCQWCPHNYYKNNSDVSANCILCPNGKMTLYRGGSSIDVCYVPCDKGTFFDVTAKKCLGCPLGTFQNGTKHLLTWCTKCNDGKVTFTNGSKDSADCVPSCAKGHFYDTESKNCSTCTVGSYQNSSNQIKCLKCPNGTSTLSIGTSNFSECTKMCQQGAYHSTQNRTCLKCPLGTFMDKADHLMLSCKKCSGDKTTYIEGVVDSAKCQDACKSGQYFNLSQYACVHCNIGTYQNLTRQLACIKCPNGTSTRAKGSTTIANCIKTCSKGTYFNVQESSCTECPLGKYMDKEEHFEEQCKKCANEKTTYVKGAAELSQCLSICKVGQYFNKSESLCKECSKGFYQDKIGQPSCMPCSPGMSTNRTGATSQLECLQSKVVCGPGESYDTKQRSCHLCANGTYQSAVNHTLTACQSCLSGKTNGLVCITSLCDDFPCKNGAECTATNQMFSCQCPKGVSGKRCDVIEKKDKLQKVETSVRFTSLKWSKELSDSSSKEYNQIRYTIEKAVWEVFKKDGTVVGMQVRRLRSGSVIADFDIYLNNNASLIPAKSLQDAVAKGSIGGLAVDPGYLNIRQVTCSQPLGMENGRITDEQIIDNGYGKGRLNGAPWRTTKENDFLQVQLTNMVNVTAIATQGDGNESFVTSYSVMYSKDGNNWEKFMDTNDTSKTKVYNANNDSSSIVKQDLAQPIKSVKFIRIIPVAHEKAIAMRIELYGCMSDPVLKSEINRPTTRPTQTEEPVKTNPNVQGVKSKKDEYAWGQYLGIAFGVLMAIVVVVSCFMWWRRSKRKRQKEDTPLVLTRFQDGKYREIDGNDEEDEEAV